VQVEAHRNAKIFPIDAVAVDPFCLQNSGGRVQKVTNVFRSEMCSDNEVASWLSGCFDIFSPNFGRLCLFPFGNSFVGRHAKEVLSITVTSAGDR
jgi:hypothetical protein